MRKIKMFACTIALSILLFFLVGCCFVAVDNEKESYKHKKHCKYHKEEYGKCKKEHNKYDYGEEYEHKSGCGCK